MQEKIEYSEFAKKQLKEVKDKPEIGWSVAFGLFFFILILKAFWGVSSWFFIFLVTGIPIYLIEMGYAKIKISRANEKDMEQKRFLVDNDIPKYNLPDRECDLWRVLNVFPLEKPSQYSTDQYYSAFETFRSSDFEEVSQVLLLGKEGSGGMKKVVLLSRNSRGKFIDNVYDQIKSKFVEGTHVYAYLDKLRLDCAEIPKIGAANISLNYRAGIMAALSSFPGMETSIVCSVKIGEKVFELFPKYFWNDVHRIKVLLNDDVSIDWGKALDKAMR